MKISLLILAATAMTFTSQALVSRAVATTDYTARVEAAISGGAARKQQWLRLGHYKPRGFLRRLIRSEFRSEADGPDLFLSPEGKTDPAAELRATLVAFAHPVAVATGKSRDDAEAVHAQCMFPARRHWIFKTLGWENVLRESGFPILKCENRRAWKNRLAAEGVSLVFASPYLGNAGSMFGHTFLKIHSRGNQSGKDLLDYGISFAAETGNDGGARFALQGIFGFYPGLFTMQPFHESLKSYSNLEGRDLVEYRIRFTPEELDFFIDHLFELERTFFDYYFLTENCAYFLLEALEAAKPDVNLSDFFWYEVIPADSVRVVARTPGLVESTKYRPSLMAMFRAQANRLSDADVQFAKDVVDNGLTTGWHEASTPALDLALDYGAVRATANPKYDEVNYKLRVERSTRPEHSAPYEIPTTGRPEEGHDPARLGLLTEIPTDHESARARLGLQFRFAYHDRLSNDAGYLKGTTLEVFRMTAFTDERDPSHVDFRELAILDIFSAQARDRFTQPLSWRASFGFREPLLTRSMGPYLNGGVGTTFQFTRYLWITALLNGEILSNPDLEPRFPVHLGPRLVATGFISPNLKLGVDYGMMRALTASRHYDFVTSELAWAATQNFEIRIGYSDALVEGIRRSEWSAKLYQHLLF